MEEAPSFRALGTTWWIEFFGTVDEKTMRAAKGRAHCFASEFEQRYSRFLPDSLVSTLNRERVIHAPLPEFIDILRFGQDMFEKTDGAFNMLVGAELERRGYDATYSFQEKTEAAEVGNPCTDLTITPERIELHRGQLDLGGFGKGWCIDQLAAILKDELHLPCFLINGGGDMYATNDGGKPITIYLEHPENPTKYVDTLTLHNHAFAASSTHKRRWKTSADTEQHHIVAEAPNTPHTATYVTAPTAALADALATTALIVPTSKLAHLSRQTASTIRPYE